MRAVLRALSSVLIVSGVLLVADAAITLTWQEPVSALLAHRGQATLERDLARVERQQPDGAERAALQALRTQSRRMAFLARRLERRTRDGQALARIAIPRIGERTVVVQGTDSAALRRGPGHFPGTDLPGEAGTVAVAGHRTTYEAPFRHIDALRRGDAIVLDLPYGRFTYDVQGTRIVAPTEVGVVRDVGYQRLVLSACHPLFSAAKRIVVFARLARSEPRGAALDA